jgi:hypothetical protein
MGSSILVRLAIPDNRKPPVPALMHRRSKGEYFLERFGRRKGSAIFDGIRD